MASCGCGSKDALAMLRRLQDNGSCDMVLHGKAGENDGNLAPIKAHKMILSAASSHLKDAFSSVGFLDSNTNEYTLDAIDHASLKVIVGYIYGCGIACVAENTVQFWKGVLIGADYLDMPELVAKCQDHIDMFLSKLTGSAQTVLSAWIDCWSFSQKYSFTKLSQEILRKIDRSSLTDLGSNETFLGLSADDVLLLLKAIIKQQGELWSSLNFDEQNCMLAVAWLGHDDHSGVSDRSQFAAKIMCAMPLSNWKSDLLQKLSEKKFLGVDLLGVINGLLKVRKSEEVLQKRCEESEKELKACKRKLGEVANDEAEKETSSKRKKQRASQNEILKSLMRAML